MSLSAQDNRPAPPLRDRLIPWYFVAAFAVVFAVNGVFVYVAVQSNSGVVTENPYKKGLDYNRTIEAAEAQEKSGLAGAIVYDEGMIRFTLTDAHGAPAEHARAEAYIRRPLSGAYDDRIALNTLPGGVFAAPYRFPLPGQWEITVNALWQQRPFQQTVRITVR